VTGIRDFFVTLFFVTLGMTFPRPGLADVAWAGTLAALLVVTRFATVFAPLYFSGKGLRFSLLPTLTLSQISELSMVLLALGQKAGDVSESVMARAGFAFAVTAVISSYGIIRSEEVLGVLIPWLKRLGLRDLDEAPPATPAGDATPRIFLLGFSWTASSLLEQLRRESPSVAADLRVVDFNPLVYARLLQQGVPVAYGDITEAEVLQHAGVGEAAIVVCSLSNTVLRGADGLTLVRRLRQINPRAQIIITSETLVDIPALYAAGASYVTVPRLLEAGEIRRALEAADKQLLHELRAKQEDTLRNRDEVVP
jgi:voltage-gated potassium channel Kch